MDFHHLHRIGLLGVANNTNESVCVIPDATQLRPRADPGMNAPLLDVCNWFGSDVEGLIAFMDARGVDIGSPVKSMSSFSGSAGYLLQASYREHVWGGKARPSFRCRAMRESRHSLLLWVPDADNDSENGSWNMLANQFVRGAEVLSIQTSNAGVETENVRSAKDLSDFADTQREVMLKLLSPPETPLHGYLSFKADGCLIGVSWYDFTSRLGQYWRQCLIAADPNDSRIVFARECLKLAEDRNWKWFPVIRSNNTAMLDLTMRSCLATALAEELQEPASLEQEREKLIRLPLEQVEHRFLPAFLEQCAKLVSTLPASLQNAYAISMSFEAVCPRRRSYWGHLQEGLAVAYSCGSLRFLGCSCGDGKSFPRYVCHGEIADLVSEAGLSQPACKQITTSGQVNDTMELLSSVIRGHITEDDFFSKFAPEQRTNLPRRNRVLDPEGFVLITDGGEYSKVKVYEYYTCHKFRPSSLDQILAIPTCAGRYFPLVAQIDRAFRMSGNTLPRLLDQVVSGLTAACGELRQQLVTCKGPLVTCFQEALKNKGVPANRVEQICMDTRKLLPLIFQQCDDLQIMVNQHLRACMEVQGARAYAEFKNLLQIGMLAIDLVSEDWDAAMRAWCAELYFYEFSADGFKREADVKRRMRKKNRTKDEDVLVNEFNKQSNVRTALQVIWKDTVG